jgi:phosphoglycerate-specific signal transduction histidine kinase
MVVGGKEVWISISLNPLNGLDGEKSCVVGVSRDITERKQMEAHLAEAQRLAAIGQAAAMVGHDLRNPLQAAVTTLYLASKLLNSGKALRRTKLSSFSTA